MTTDNDVTALFEQNAVAQIQEMLNKTRNDIEKKKEDLRIMVGERYRDLIEAADTIAEMRESAEAICGNIHTMEGLCDSLQQRGLIGFKTHNHGSTSERSSVVQNHYSVAVQVKILVSVPEVLWSLTESAQYLPAARLLLLAQYTHTALQLQPPKAKVMTWFPVIERQWSSIAQFRATIVKAASTLISTEIDDLKGVLDGVVAMMLVENCSTHEALDKILRLRRKALMDAICDKPSATAKGQICSFVTLFIASLNIIHYLFIKESGNNSNNSNSCVESRLLEVTGVGDESPLALLQESSLALSFLPQDIANFRPSISTNSKTNTSVVDVKTTVAQWIDGIMDEASISLATLLGFSSSLKALSLIRSSVWEICQERLNKDNWDKITEDLYTAPLDPWTSIIRSQVTARSRQVITNQLSATKEAILQMVESLTSDIITDPRICQEEGDISGFVWSEAAGDLPERIGWTSAATRPLGQTGGLYYKSRGYTSRLQTICRALNSRLTALLEDVQHFAPISTRNENYAGTFALRDISNRGNSVQEQTAVEDYTALCDFLQEASGVTFLELVRELESLGSKQLLVSTVAELESSSIQDHHGWEEISTVSPPPSPSATVSVVVGRLCHSLPNICSQMQICAAASLLTQPEMLRRVNLGSKVENEAWTSVRSEYLNANVRLIDLFLSSLTSRLQVDLEANLALLSEGGVAAVITTFPTWEVVEIEEEGESGKVVKSGIHVPAHPTPALSQGLARLCSSLNCVATHTITRNSQVSLVQKTCETVTSVYEKILSNKGKINQTEAFQLIFDLRYIQATLLPREAKEIGARQIQVIQNLETQVDPFDLDVFTPHITQRVKLAAHRSQVLLGSVLARDRQTLSTRAPATTASTSNNSLPLVAVTEIPRFSNVPLPISPQSSVMTTSYDSALHGSSSITEEMSKLSGIKADNSRGSVRVQKEVTSAAISASKSAASLFSAMSNSWFGGATNS